ncbi:MAG TPA: hypothetical protein DER60_12695 [Syntrophomonas sp.]|nr:hypothetical protein [Syntrophomonas sp.]
MIFDCHAHVGYSKFADRLITAEAVLEVMDRAGIDKALLLPTASTGKYYSGEQMLAEANQAPDRLVPFAGVNPKDKNALNDFEEAVTQYGARGLKIHPVSAACAADDQHYVYPLVEMAEALGVPVMFHSGEAPYATPWQVGLVAMDFPRATIIMEHMGFDAMVFTGAAIKMARKCPNLILGTTGVMYEFPIAAAVDSIGEDRVIYGGELPMNNPVHEILKVRCARISQTAQEKILGKNLARLLSIQD